MGKKTLNALDEYINKVYFMVLLIVPGACQCAGLTFTFEKVIGWYPTVSLPALIIFDITCLIYLTIGIYLVRTGYSKEGTVLPHKLKLGKIYIVIIMLIQFNFILYMIPFQEFWAFAFFFVALTMFFLDVKVVGITIGEISISLIVSWFLRSDITLPAKDELFMPNIINRIICLVLSLVCIYIVTYFIGHFLVSAKKEELQQNNERIQTVLSTASRLAEDLLNAGSALSQISSNESASAQELSATSEILLTNSNTLSGKSDESITNLNELKEWGNIVNENVEKVGASSRNLLQKSKENKQLLDSLQSVNGEVVQSMAETSQVAGKLSEAVKEIGATLNLINDISESTNLLALNASIEAARAGESGKGFAVVAQEVGNLANSTKESLTEVEKVIDKVQGNVREITVYVGENSEKLSKQNEYFSNVFAGIQEMIDLLQHSMDDIETMNHAHSRQADVIKTTVTISEDIANSIKQENQEFSSISGMVENNTNDVAQMTDQIVSINKMVEEIDMLLKE